jgi:hypothetical protein
VTFPEIEMWSGGPPLDDAALVAMIEASNAYALCEFHDPVNEIYDTMWRAVAGYLPELLQIAVKERTRV